MEKKYPVQDLDAEQYRMCLDRQIETLMSGDYQAFTNEVRQGDKDTWQPVCSHADAWHFTGHHKRSLFANLPVDDTHNQTSWCASQIEHLPYFHSQHGSVAKNESEYAMWKHWQRISAKADRPVLPQAVPMGDGRFKFSREELNEFARRQMLIRYGEEY